MQNKHDIIIIFATILYRSMNTYGHENMTCEEFKYFWVNGGYPDDVSDNVECSKIGRFE